MGRERERHGPEPPLKPQPLFKWGCFAGTLLSFSRAGIREGCENGLISNATMALLSAGEH